MPNQTVRPVSISEIFDTPHIAELFLKYGAECSIPLIGPINPLREIYEAMERTGLLKCLGAFDGERLIGFATVILSILPHYSKKAATMESLFVDPAGRSSGAGKELLDAVEALAVESGCAAILYSAPIGGRLERLLTLLGVPRTNTVFCKRLA